MPIFVFRPSLIFLIYPLRWSSLKSAEQQDFTVLFNFLYSSVLFRVTLCFRRSFIKQNTALMYQISSSFKSSLLTRYLLFRICFYTSIIYLNLHSPLGSMMPIPCVFIITFLASSLLLQVNIKNEIIINSKYSRYTDSLRSKKVSISYYNINILDRYLLITSILLASIIYVSTISFFIIS